jgi:hypothetical protein
MGVNPGQETQTPAEIGSKVGIRFGDMVLPATVVEDRGELGPNGERLVRVSVNATPTATTTFEVLFSTLLPAPKTKNRNSKEARSNVSRRRRAAKR